MPAVNILSITLPIYLILLLGWLAVRQRVFEPAELRVMGRFVMQIALPALLFKALASRPLLQVLDAGYLSAIALGSLAVFAAVYGWVRYVRHDSSAAAAIQAMGSSFSNSGYIGYPLALQFMESAAGIALALNLLVENLLMLPLVLTLAQATGAPGHRWPQVLAQSLAALARNPMVLAILTGLAVAALELPLPSPLWKAIDMMALASTAVALFVVGGSLAGLSTRGLAGPVSQIAMAKLILHPLAVYGALWLVPQTRPELRALAVVMAAVPMLSIYPILAQRYGPPGAQGSSAAALLGATVISFGTLGVWLWLVSSKTLPGF